MYIRMFGSTRTYHPFLGPVNEKYSGAEQALNQQALHPTAQKEKGALPEGAPRFLGFVR